MHADFANKEGQDFLVMVAAHSKWPEILPMSSTTAAATIAAFRDVFARFGFPVNVVTDNGPQFINAKFDEFLRWNGVKHIRVAPYHPVSNGAAERMVQSLKRSVKASASTGASLRHRLADFLLTLYGPYILESVVHDGFAFIKKGGFPYVKYGNNWHVKG